MGESKGTLLTPRDIGLPQKFKAWRDNQEDAVVEYLDSTQRYVAQCAPTGSGKSIIAVADAVLTGGKSVYLTSTKALQSQLLSDFGEIGMVEIKGKNAYRCLLDKFGRGCNYGDCNFGIRCEHQNKDCHYYTALKRARESSLIVTNYAYWLTMKFYGEGLLANHAPADLLILDEAHHADHHLVDLLTFHIRAKETDQLLGIKTPTSASYVSRWAKMARDKADQDYTTMKFTLLHEGKGSRDELHKMQVLVNKLEHLVKYAANKDWMVQIQDGVKICPVWPRDHAEDNLFAGARKVLMMSATVRPKTVEMLGLVPVAGKGDEVVRGEILRAQVEGGARGESCLFSDYPSIFDSSRRLVIHVPTVRMNHLTTAEGHKVWLKRIDQIIAPRLHQKGIIHTVSYERRNMVMNQSEYAEYMVTHDSGSVIDTVDRFKKASAPCILVSPSVMTGFDFPHDLCRWQIIGKIAFPDTRDRLLRARMEKDPDYGAYLAMQSLVQSSGRGTRAPNDYCVSFLIDDSAFWFMKKYRHFAPRWFMDGYRTSELIPQVGEIA